MVITLIIVIILILGICGYIITNLLKKVEILEGKYEESQIYMNSLSKIIGDSNSKLKELDEKGTFKGDDEIGWFFKSILYIQEILNQYNLNEKDKTKTSQRDNIFPTTEITKEKEAKAKDY